MLSKLTKLSGAQRLSKSDQRTINGGIPFQGCNGNCAGLPSGTRCYHMGHCGCPGACNGGNCWPY